MKAGWIGNKILDEIVEKVYMGKFNAGTQVIETERFILRRFTRSYVDLWDSLSFVSLSY